MRIETRALHDVTVLDLKGAIVNSDDSHIFFSDTIRTLIASGARKVVLNMAEVPYVDSSGLGAIVKAYFDLSRSGIQLWFSHPTARMQDLFDLTKLSTVFEVISPEHVVGSLAEERLVASCPSCEQGVWIPLRPGPEYNLCPKCHIELKLSSWPSVPTDEMEVECAILRAQTYDNEYVRLVIGTTQTITVERRLDLFASDAVTRIWHLVPPPRRVVFEFAQSQYTEAGLQPLLDLCGMSDDTNRSAIVISGVTATSRDSLPAHPAVHERMSDAEVTLGISGDQLPSLHVRVRKA